MGRSGLLPRSPCKIPSSAPSAASGPSAPPVSNDTHRRHDSCRWDVRTGPAAASPLLVRPVAVLRDDERLCQCGRKNKRKGARRYLYMLTASRVAAESEPASGTNGRWNSWRLPLNEFCGNPLPSRNVATSKPLDRE